MELLPERIHTRTIIIFVVITKSPLYGFYKFIVTPEIYKCPLSHSLTNRACHQTFKIFASPRGKKLYMDVCNCLYISVILPLTPLPHTSVH